ncbi:hypothetical protein SUGI_1000280 [Cryptomeria japonica]|nr:hypothetical protein SUGI_1000280 [Cryptomeria japonica]
MNVGLQAPADSTNKVITAKTCENGKRQTVDVKGNSTVKAMTVEGSCGPSHLKSKPSARRMCRLSEGLRGKASDVDMTIPTNRQTCIDTRQDGQVHSLYLYVYFDNLQFL